MILAPGADVVPLDDLRTHVVPGGYDDGIAPEWLVLERPAANLYTECWCAPRLEPVISPDGSLGVIYVHRAMDQRQERE